jgi:stage II sporulation protein D
VAWCSCDDVAVSRTLLASFLLTTALIAPTAPAVAEPAAQPEPVRLAAEAPRAGTSGDGRSVTLHGHGYGHGKGLSQYGAQRAAKRGRSHRQILGYYYPRTRIGKTGGRIKVWLSGDRGNNLVVRDRDGLRVRSLGAKRTWRLRESRARKWRITPIGDGRRSRIAWQGRGRWKTWRRVKGDAEFSAGGAPVRLLGPARASYRGALRSASHAGGRVSVNVLPLEQYLRGVVPLEVPALWEPAAVRAQAVAARTYAAFERRHTTRRAYDLCDTAACQVYGGRSAEHPASDAAVRTTRKQVVVKRRRPIFAQFNASSGGWTVDGGRPYLVARRDRFDDWTGNPHHAWRQTLGASEIEKQYPGIGELQGIRIDRRDGNGDWNGRVLEMTLLGADGQTSMSGDDFRVRFGLRSTWFRVTTDL